MQSSSPYVIRSMSSSCPSSSSHGIDLSSLNIWLTNEQRLNHSVNWLVIFTHGSQIRNPANVSSWNKKYNLKQKTIYPSFQTEITFAYFKRFIKSTICGKSVSEAKSSSFAVDLRAQSRHHFFQEMCSVSSFMVFFVSGKNIIKCPFPWHWQ